MNNATHKAKDGTLYRKQGKFWMVYRGNAWWVMSGEPVIKLEKLR